MCPQKNVHLICNAHIDPVWLWQWQEGAAEAISTFRTAADFCETFDSFIFNHNEVILYEWIQQFDPPLFKRIQKLVKQGKWHIMGGWYLQPDCNMPSGEALVRQITTGRQYFKKHFGVEPKTAINFDPFGHSQGLVQILAKSGYDSYLFGRPEYFNLKLPANEFTWKGFDGSSVTAFRFDFPYLSYPGQAVEKIEKLLNKYPDRDVHAILWGMGNHGGGPSKKDLRDIARLIKTQKNKFNIKHSTPEAYFKELKKPKGELPVVDRDLNPLMVGCYSSAVRIKQKYRRLENELFSLEKMLSAAAVQQLLEYPSEQLEDIERDMLYGAFHDILPGSSIEAVEQDALQMMDHGLEIASRLKARAFFALATGQKKSKAGQIPILVYNPHPFKVRTTIECEFNMESPQSFDNFTQVKVYENSKLLPSQVEHEDSSMPAQWRKKVVFHAELQPSQMNRFDCKLITLKAKPKAFLPTRGSCFIFKTPLMEIHINKKTGLIDKYSVKGTDCLKSGAFRPIALHDNDDSWGHEYRYYERIIGKFELMSLSKSANFTGTGEKLLDPVRVIEDGPCRTVIEALFEYNDSMICQRYLLPKHQTQIEIETRVYWLEKTKMLKLDIPTKPADCNYIGQTAYGSAELPNDGQEAVAQKWLAVVSKKENLALTCITEGTYASDYKTGRSLRLTLLRSPCYSAHPAGKRIGLSIPQDRFNPRIDQGMRIFRFWINAGNATQSLSSIDRRALVQNEKPHALSFFPSGDGKKPKPLAILSDNVIQITAIKKAAKNNNLIVRLFEPTGKKRATVLSLPFVGKKIKVELNPFEIKTLKINPNSGSCKEVNLLER